ncbi:MAG: diguanylate cyclase [Candidatus Sericytochromatia bacterium]|nr:diguanylate cyclase [Candidatus Tanganyikabacteria bacterium]
METLTQLSQDQLGGLVAIARKIAPSTNWEYNYGLIREALKEGATGVSAAIWWPAPDGAVSLAGAGADAFDAFTSSKEIEDILTEAEKVEFQPIAEVEGGYRTHVMANRQTYGVLLLKGDDPEFLQALARVLTTPLGLAAHALKLEEEVNKRTSTDKLTGLWNRMYFNERFREECERLVRSKETGSVAIVSLDNFSALAKTMSPDQANATFAQVGQVVRQVVRQTDWAVRWDGYDLLFYFPSTSAEAGVEVLKRFTKRLLSISPMLEPLAGVSSTVETTSPRALVQLATRRLDLARKDGNRKVICYATPGGGLQFYRGE